MERPLFIALDFPSAKQTIEFVQSFDNTEGMYVKVGMELFYQDGPKVIQELKDLGVKIFLDLKFHDIPNTVHGAARSCGRLGVDFMTVHALGGKQMIAAAKEGLVEGAKESGIEPAKLLAISQLTSTSQEVLNNDLQIPGKLADSVVHLTKMAIEGGADGMVSSALEVPALKKVAPKDFLFVTPGIRPASSISDDQVRVVTPSKAHQLGSTGIVVGRPITQAENSILAYRSIKQEWEHK